MARTISLHPNKPVTLDDVYAVALEGVQVSLDDLLISRRDQVWLKAIGKHDTRKRNELPSGKKSVADGDETYEARAARCSNFPAVVRAALFLQLVNLTHAEVPVCLLKSLSRLIGAVKGQEGPENDEVLKVLSPHINSDVSFLAKTFELVSKCEIPAWAADNVEAVFIRYGFPLSVAETIVSARQALTAGRLCLASTALLLEVLRVPTHSIDSMAQMRQTETAEAVNTIRWLLDESKVERPKHTTEASPVAVAAEAAADMPSLLAGLRVACDAAAILGRQAVLTTETRLTLKQRSAAIAPIAAALKAQLNALRDSLVERISNGLLPQMKIVAEQTSASTLAVWNEKEPLPSTISEPPCAQPVNQKALDILSDRLLTENLDAQTSLSSIPSLNRHVALDVDALLKVLSHELAALWLVYQAMAVEAYNKAVEKALKKKKNPTSKVYVGRPLSSILSELETRAFLNVASSEFTADTFIKVEKLLLDSQRLGALEKVLVKVFVPSNQESRKPKVPKGTLDANPSKMVIREAIFDVVLGTFKRYGAVQIDTPVFELRETLLGKYGEDQKLIFDLKDQGGEQLSLRYDLTVPFARYVATQGVDKIKRYHIGKVYRRDEPQIAKGRFREFFQCDFDIAGIYDVMVPDSEVVAIQVDIFRQLERLIGNFEVRINHRALLDAIMSVAGVPQELFRTICAAIDKLDKETWDTVKEEMCVVKGLPEESADIIETFVKIKGPPREVLRQLEGTALLKDCGSAQETFKDLIKLFEYLEAMDVTDKVTFDMSLARGLDYYTGIIFETVLIGENQSVVGSVSGGGRYDKLVGMFAGKQIPAVGVSIGVERLFRVIEHKYQLVPSAGDVFTSDGQMKKEGLAAGARVSCPAPPQHFKPAPVLKKQPTMVLVCSADENIAMRMRLCKTLRDSQIPAEIVYTRKGNFGKNLQYASENRIPIVVLFGETELKENAVKIRTLSFDAAEGTKEAAEEQVQIPELVDKVKQILNSSATVKALSSPLSNFLATKTATAP